MDTSCCYGNTTHPLTTDLFCFTLLITSHTCRRDAGSSPVVGSSTKDTPTNLTNRNAQYTHQVLKYLDYQHKP